PDRHRTGKVGLADDDGDRRTADRIAEDDEAGDQPAVQRDRRLAGDGQRADEVVAELGHGAGGDRDQRRGAHRPAPRHARRPGRGGGLCGGLANSGAAIAAGPAVSAVTARSTRSVAASAKIDVASSSAARSTRTGSFASRPSTRARRAVMTSRGGVGWTRLAKAAMRSWVAPSTGM